MAIKRSRKGVCKLSSTTSVVDCRSIIREYLKSIGHTASVIGAASIFVRYEKGHAVAVGPTEESVN